MKFGLIILSLLAFQVVPAQSLLEKREAQQQMDNIKDDMESMNKKCDAKMTFKYDLKSFGDKKTWHEYSPSSRCVSLVNALFSICDTPDGKEAVKKNIKELTCNFGGAGKRAFKKAGNKLNYTVDWGSANDQEFLKGEIEKSL